MPGTNSYLTVAKLTVTTLSSTTMTGHTVAVAAPPSFALKPRTVVGEKATNYRKHPNTQAGKHIKVR